MIELPEATVIAQQMNAEISGKQIVCGIRGNSPHKFAFYSRTPEEYESILTGNTVQETREYGSCILTRLESDDTLVLGGGGERILVHQSEKTLPKKHQLLLHFHDDTYLTVTVQGWGSVLLLRQPEIATHPHIGAGRISPLSEAFTLEHFQTLFDELEAEDARSIKHFIISKPGILGIGNGYLQDILFRARIYPRRRAVDITDSEKEILYEAIRDILSEAIDRCGRDTERDLYNNPGGYRRTMDNRAVGQPCPECGTPVEKMQFLGGASYFCPHCQV